MLNYMHVDAELSIVMITVFSLIHLTQGFETTFLRIWEYVALGSVTRKFAYHYVICILSFSPPIVRISVTLYPYILPLTNVQI
jgi:hypothetical protein